MKTQSWQILFFLLPIFRHSDSGNVSIGISPKKLTLLVLDDANFSLILSSPLVVDQTIQFEYDIGTSVTTDGKKQNIIHPLENQTFAAGETARFVTISAIGAGHVVLSLSNTSTGNQISNIDKPFIRVNVIMNRALVTIIAVLGWIYFAAWSISFYPQIVLNFMRKSVTGLSLDYVLINLLGFFCYSVYNIGLYWVPTIQADYFRDHPHGVNPVLLNDVIFALHAFFMNGVCCIQCLIYERGGNSVSKPMLAIFCLSILGCAVGLFFPAFHVINWFQYLNFFSYVKLGITIIKYCPQVWTNFRRKSTVGFSIGNVLLDCTGGTFSILQMFLQSYNNDDWTTIFGDFTKFGLGVFSIMFDIVFMVQHYCLYRGNMPYADIDAEADEYPRPVKPAVETEAIA